MPRIRQTRAFTALSVRAAWFFSLSFVARFVKIDGEDFRTVNGEIQSIFTVHMLNAFQVYLRILFELID